MFKVAKYNKKACLAYRCRNEKAKGKTLCPKHLKRRAKEINPASYFYSILRQNAKRRGKEFLLTIEEFKGFCEKTNYLKVKGRYSRSKTIDRIDPSKGYSIDNIQIMSNKANASKRWEDVPF